MRVLIACVALWLAAAPCWGAEPWRTLPFPPAMPPPSASGLADLRGIKMYYAIYGQGDPVLLIHGGLSDADVWAALIAPLAEHHRVIVADTRGHGRSTRTAEPFSYAMLAEDYLALLDRLGIGPVALVGWSDGGIIGLQIAIDHPGRLTSLFAQAANATPAGLVADPSGNALAASGPRNRREYRRLSSTPSQYPAFEHDIEAMWATEPHFTTAQLASITTRTAIVLGDHDELIRRDHSEYLANTIPGARMIVLHGVSHFAVLQDPSGYTRAVLDFLDAR